MHDSKGVLWIIDLSLCIALSSENLFILDLFKSEFKTQNQTSPVFYGYLRNKIWLQTDGSIFIACVLTQL